jgi:PEP-CTERM motif
MKFAKSALAAAALVSGMASAVAGPTVVLDFEGIGDEVSVNDFYNGGTDGAGNSGTNYGVHFNSNALGIIDADAGGTGNFGNEPSPSTILFFLTGSAILDYAPGFDTGFSFWYTTVSFGGTVKVYDGLGATGNLLGSITIDALGAGPGDPNGTFSNWAIGSLAFAGIAKSIDFGGTVNQVGYDDITFGSATPGIPEPSTYAMLALGLAGVGFVSRRRKAS